MHAPDLIGLVWGGWQGWLLRPLALFEDTTNIVFFKLVNDFLQREIDRFGIELLGRTLRWIGLVALSAMTLWIMLIAVAVFLPVITLYTAWVYRVMRGKVTHESVGGSPNSY